jgi:hypothetical protein
MEHPLEKLELVVQSPAPSLFLGGKGSDPRSMTVCSSVDPWAARYSECLVHDYVLCADRVDIYARVPRTGLGRWRG